jgi:plastocyanin
VVAASRRSAVAVVLLVLAPAALGACGSDEGADGPASAARTIEITASEYEFNGDPGVIEPGDTIEFDVENVGQIDHSLEVLSSTGSSLGRTERIVPGASDTVSVTFVDAGVYRLICDVDDHLSRGQTASITVG